MEKNRALDTQPSEYASLWRRQTEGAGSQSHGWDIFCIADRLPVERLKWNWYLFQQYGSFQISGVGKSRRFSETLEDGIAWLRRIERDWRVLAIHGWSPDQGPAGRGKKPAQTLRTELKKALNAVCLPKAMVYLLAWRLMAPIDMIAKWRKRP